MREEAFVGASVCVMAGTNGMKAYVLTVDSRRDDGGSMCLVT